MAISSFASSRPSSVNSGRVVAAAERRLGRRLTTGERIVDVETTDSILERGKERLTAAIEREKRRAVDAYLAGLHSRLEITDGMVAVLNALHKAGREQAVAEIKRLGIAPATLLADPIPSHQPLYSALRAMLGNITNRIDVDARRMTLAPTSPDLFARELHNIPGSKDAAGRLVSAGFLSGADEIYEANRELFPGWQYSALLDAATCSECRARDGETYLTLDDAYRVMPNFGPNPLCYGDGRCRCRLVPLPPPSDVDVGSPGTSEPLPPGPIGLRDPRDSAMDFHRITPGEMDPELVNTIVEETLEWPEGAGDVAASAIFDASEGDVDLWLARDPDGLLRAVAGVDPAGSVGADFSSYVVRDLASNGGGAGTTLLQQIARQAAAEGKGVRLVALPDAMPYYERLGFRVVENAKPAGRVFEIAPGEAERFGRGEQLVREIRTGDTPSPLPLDREIDTTGGKDLGAGSVNETYKVEIDGESYVVKPVTGGGRRMRENIPANTDVEREIASFRVFERLRKESSIGVGMKTPEIGLGKVKGGPALVSRFVPGIHPRGDEWKVVVSQEQIDAAAFYDVLIGNTDRHGRNFMLELKGARAVGPGDADLVLIDHGLTFPDWNAGYPFNARLFDGRLDKNLTGQERGFLLRLIDDETAVTAELREAGLSDGAIDAFWERIEFMQTTGRVGWAPGGAP